jgi:nicotinate-nucleotide--dimethylbenzimidazole phosphoribosyltransferase
MTSPLDDIRALIATLPGPDEQARAAAAAALSPPGTHGRLEALALWLAAWSGKERPQIRRPILALYAGAPGPGQLEAAEQARAQLEAVASGGAVVARLATAQGAGLEAFDLAIDRPIGEIANGPALGEREAAATMAFGMEVLAKQPDLLMLSEIAPAGTHNAAAVARAALHGDGSIDGLEILRHYGGREIAAIAGAILGARIQKVPVILDGFGATAAAAALRQVDPHAIDHCLFAARPAFGPHADLIAALGGEPLVDLAMPASDGTGALAALSMVKLAASVLDPGP